MSIRSILLALAAGAAASASFAADAPSPAACSVTVSNPQNGESVGASGQVSGQASMPDSASLWIIARPAGFDGWWPQGGGAVSVNDGTWEATVYYGSPQDVGRFFEVVVEPVDAKTNDRLTKWYAHANATHDFTPMALPSPIPGCKVAKLRVRKTG